jgi:predicted xylose isomerase-like sugar epimerase
MPSTKGDPIRFKGGKYKGQTGWRNDDKQDTRHRTYVIVTLLDGTVKETWVKRRNVAAPRGHPTNYFEAVLQQHPDIEGLVEQLCFEIARCYVTIIADAIIN